MNQEKTGTELFYDTYALYALACGWPSYQKYAKGKIITTSIMNLYELYYSLCKDSNNKLAEEFLQRLQSSCIVITFDAIKSASLFRLRNIKKRMSYIDCLGYKLAMQKGIKFLTGDKEFANLPNVEFIK